MPLRLWRQVTQVSGWTAHYFSTFGGIRASMLTGNMGQTKGRSLVPVAWRIYEERTVSCRPSPQSYQGSRNGGWRTDPANKIRVATPIGRGRTCGGGGREKSQTCKNGGAGIDRGGGKEGQLGLAGRVTQGHDVDKRTEGSMAQPTKAQLPLP